MKYRVEDKYIITEDMLVYLNERLKQVMKPDENMSDGSYLIRSLYFDDIYNSCVNEIEGGLNHREKFRIRTYNNDSSLIKLELKGKTNGKTSKQSVTIDDELVKAIIDSGYVIDSDSPFLLKKLWTEQKMRLLAPVNIVEYERSAFVEGAGNVRITFDRNISASNNITAFFDDNICATPLMPAGQHILEVKYDELLPGYIRKIIDTGKLQRISYSKYYYSRRGFI